MPSMATKAWTSRVLRRKGESCHIIDLFARRCVDANPWNNRFGWVNASYVYGLQIVNAHMRRALGTLTPYETFVKALEENRAKALSEMV